MNETKTIKQRGKRFTLGLVILSAFLTVLLISLGNRLLRDLHNIPTAPDRQAIEQEYRNQLQSGDELWEQAQPFIEESIDAESREVLLAGAVPLGFDGETFYLGIPDETQRQSVNNIHRKKLQDALREASGQELEISLYGYHGWTWTEPLEVYKRRDLEKAHREAQDRLKTLNEQTPELESEIKTARATLDTLLNVQKAKSDAGETLSPNERAQLEKQQAFVIEKQEQIQAHQTDLAAARKAETEAKETVDDINKAIADRDQRASTAFNEAVRTYRTKIFFLQLLLIVALLLVSVYILVKKRPSPYIVIYMSVVVTTAWLFWGFLHEYVPKDFLYYVLRLIGVAVLLGLMIQLVRRFHALSKNRLMKQIRDALLAKKCPNCNFPYFEGRAQYEVLGQRDRKILNSAPSGNLQIVKTAEAPHNFCQNCGMPIMDTCKECGAEKFALLPHCPKCNAETDVIGTYEAHINNEHEA